MSIDIDEKIGLVLTQYYIDKHDALCPTCPIKTRDFKKAAKIDKQAIRAIKRIINLNKGAER